MPSTEAIKSCSFHGCTSSSLSLSDSLISSSSITKASSDGLNLDGEGGSL
uniref:Uncharacterized protein n=1 Tax=Arundo donax TaxID=35708 RepID=A0A0A9HR26_ARUDO